MEKTNCGETIDVIDRISTLPDAVRGHILSFLSTKEAVGTCVLSKGWKNAWSSVPVLRFDLKEFLPDHNFPDKQIVIVCEAKLKRFVKGVLKNRGSSHREKFELLWDTARCTRPFGPGTSEPVEGCVLPAMRFKPRVLSVSLPKYELPNFKTNPIFSCESLQDVLLKFNFGNGYFRIAPTTVHLPFLKKLYLSGVILCDDFVNKIFMGCQVLEELSLSYCDLKVSNISSSTLKKLFLLDCRGEQNWMISTPNQLNREISTPNLLNLEISTPYPFGYKNTISLNKMVSLLNARIRSSFDYNFTNGEPKFLGLLSNVAKLELSLNDAQVKGLLEKEVPNCPIFNHLKTLILGCWSMSRDFELVAFFLRSPNLQRLTLYPFDNIFLLPEKMSSQEVARGALFQREQLDIVKIIRRGNKEEWIDRLVNILHSHVKIIGKIIITDYNWGRMRN